MAKKKIKNEKKKAVKKNSDNKKSRTTMNKKSSKKTDTTSKKEKKEQKVKQQKTSKSNTKKETVSKDKKQTQKKEEKKRVSKKATSKPKTKKIYDEDDDLLDEEEFEQDDTLVDEDEDVAEVEEIDLSNIEPIISDVDTIEEEEEEYTPKTRGRKKQVQPETQHPLTMEELIRNRPLQIDPTKKVYVTKKEDEPKPYVTSGKNSKARYSDGELQEFKEIILQRLKETKENYDQLKKYFTNQDDNGIDDTSPTFKMIEDGSGVMTKEEIEQQLARLEKYMIDLQNALLRIENKTYGICTVTGKLIPKERLRSVPHATKSIEAKISRDI